MMYPPPANVRCGKSPTALHDTRILGLSLLQNGPIGSTPMFALALIVLCGTRVHARRAGHVISGEHTEFEGGAREGRAGRLRLLVLCTHNSARSQMAEGWLRKYAAEHGLDAEVWSAGTEATRVKENAIAVMDEVAIDLSNHTSKTLWDVPDPWAFDVVVTVCDSANEACPAYPAQTTRLHVSFPDPTGHDLAMWRSVRDRIGTMCERLVAALVRGETPREEDLAS